MDKDIQYIFSVPQDIIRASAYYDTGAFPRKIFYDLYLREIELILLAADSPHNALFPHRMHNGRC